MTVKIVWAGRETAYAGWRRRWKHWGEWLTEDDQAHGKFIDNLFDRAVEKVPYERCSARLVPNLWTECFTTRGADLDMWSCGDHVRKGWFTSNH